MVDDREPALGSRIWQSGVAATCIEDTSSQ